MKIGRPWIFFFFFYLDIMLCQIDNARKYFLSSLRPNLAWTGIDQAANLLTLIQAGNFKAHFSLQGIF